MAADTLKLTDEEAAVIAVLADGAWRTPLLTINEASKAELAASVLRGRRSLVVRDLADASAEDIEAYFAHLGAIGLSPATAARRLSETWSTATAEMAPARASRSRRKLTGWAFRDRRMVS